jgi:Ca-activated chloride channel family protein
MLRHFFRLLSTVLAIALLAAPALAADKAIIILDASGSMWAQINGKARIDIARDSLKSVLSGVPAELELGFMAYGHRSKGDCNDIELLVEPAAGTADLISSAAAQLNPKGKTPLSAAVKMAAEKLKYTEDKATVILITDGLETCDADPCALATELGKDGVEFKVDVVGLALSQEDADKVRCIADNTHGQYLQADDGDALQNALTEVVADVTPTPTPEPPAPSSSEEPATDITFAPTLILVEGGEPTDNDGVAWEFYKINSDGSQGDWVRTEYGTAYKWPIEPGEYLVNAKLDYAQVRMPVTIEAGKIAKPEFDLEAGFIDVKPIHSEGEDVNGDATVVLDLPNGENTTAYGEVKAFVPAGTTKLTVTIGSATVTDAATVKAGEHVDKTVVVGAGHVTITAFYAEGTAVEDGNVYFDILEAKKDIEGNRKEVTNAYGPSAQFDLSPGEYVAATSLDAAKIEQPFTIKAGEASTVEVTLNAGVLAVTGGVDDAVEVFGAKKNIEGKRVSFGTNYGPEVDRILPAGDYHLVITLANNAGTKEADVTIKAGERTEYAIPQ